MGGGEEGGEAIQNKEALILAFTGCGLNHSQYEIHEDRDATALASELADKWWLSQGTSKPRSDVAPVSLANAANERLFGNHWFAGGALRAIDENLHRRAPTLAAISLLLNGGTSAKHRAPSELAQRVVELGGDVETFTASPLVV